MGKTNRPLRMLLDRSIVVTEEDKAIIAKLIEQGHTIDLIDLRDYDIHGGTRFFRMFSLKYLPMAMASARRDKANAAAKKKSDTPKKEV